MTPEQFGQLTPSEADRFLDDANQRLRLASDEFQRTQAVEDLLVFSHFLNRVAERQKPEVHYTQIIPEDYSRFDWNIKQNEMPL